MCLNRSSRKIVSYLHDGLRLEKENIFKQKSCLKSFLLLGLKHAEVGELGQGQFILSRDGLGQEAAASGYGRRDACRGASTGSRDTKSQGATKSTTGLHPQAVCAANRVDEHNIAQKACSV